jgi:hypothetical protein
MNTPMPSLPPATAEAAQPQAPAFSGAAGSAIQRAASAAAARIVHHSSWPSRAEDAHALAVKIIPEEMRRDGCAVADSFGGWVPVAERRPKTGRTRNHLNNMKTSSAEGIREQQPHAGRSLWAVVSVWVKRYVNIWWLAGPLAAIGVGLHIAVATIHYRTNGDPWYLAIFFGIVSVGAVAIWRAIRAFRPSR